MSDGIFIFIRKLLFTLHSSFPLKGVRGSFLFSLFTLISLPLWAEGGKSQIELADPYILLDGGKYYAYGTRDDNGIRCYSSDDLRSWKYEGLCHHT